MMKEQRWKSQTSSVNNTLENNGINVMVIFKDTPYLYFLFSSIWLPALFILFAGKESLQKKIKPNTLMLKK